MAHVSETFNGPFLLGFDHFERTLDRISKTSAEGYPPYNIEQIAGSLHITFAVAGFSEAELSVTLESNQLTVVERIAADETERVLLRYDTSARQFQRSFILVEGIEVISASLDRGLLHIDLSHLSPETQVCEIKIGKGAPKTPRR